MENKSERDLEYSCNQLQGNRVFTCTQEDQCYLKHAF